MDGDGLEGPHRSFQEEGQHLRREALHADQGPALCVSLRLPGGVVNQFVVVDVIGAVSRRKAVIELVGALDAV
jgi:hypothetical protein